MSELHLTMPQAGKDSNPATLKVTNVRFEHFREPVGIDIRRPRLSWIVSTPTENWHQAAYQLEAYNASQQLRAQTGRIESNDCVLVAWPFEPLESREQVGVRVRVRGRDGSVSPWSELGWIEAGLLRPSDWSARFVSPDWEDDTLPPGPCPLLRREFGVRTGIRRARLYISALGVYEAQLNGTVVGDQIMAPGWTSYHHRLRYQTFDVTDLVQVGQNAIGVTLGDGWFRGRIGFGGGRRNIYGDQLALLGQLEITYQDGVIETVVTDESWRAATGPILASDIYDGETYDARLERPGWSNAGYPDDDWAPTRQVEWDMATLVAPLGPPVRCTEVIRPVAIFTSPSGRSLVDFGQNLVGKLRLTVQGQAGHSVIVRHAEVLENGELCTRPLRTARATDHYTLKGEGVETWEPHFTFHGFRYAEIENWPGSLILDDICARVCHSDMERTGWFECSDSLINRFHENVVWSMRGNFFDIPTDCPQRDERIGWTGDIQVFAPAASFLYESFGFLASWLQDLAAEQLAAGGTVPIVVPHVQSGPPMEAAAWSDAAVFVPWVLYQRFGDPDILATQFESMCAWVDQVASLAGEGRLWDKGFQFGDWLDPAAPPDRPGDARTNPQLIATAYFARSAELVGQAAGVLGRIAEEAHYRALASEIRQAFVREYMTPNGRLLSDSQTAYALAIEFDLLPAPELRQRAAERLMELVRANGYRIGTGFVGTPLVCDALCHTGNYAAAYRLLLQRECPSWLYPVTMGATTIWERWDSLLPDGSVNPGEMTSFNHYALGAVADWLHRTVGGLMPARPGSCQITIQPHPGGGLTHCRTRHRMPFGMAECAWKLEGGTFDLNVIVPPNATALVILPGSDTGPIEVGSGIWHWSVPYQNPEVRGLYTVDDLVGDLLSDNTARDAILDALERAEAPDFLRAMIFNDRGLPLRQALRMAPNYEAAVKIMSDTLASLESGSVDDDESAKL